MDFIQATKYITADFTEVCATMDISFANNTKCDTVLAKLAYVAEHVTRIYYHHLKVRKFELFAMKLGKRTSIKGF